jgi:hypothetical protein
MMSERGGYVLRMSFKDVCLRFIHSMFKQTAKCSLTLPGSSL